MTKDDLIKYINDESLAERLIRILGNPDLAKEAYDELKLSGESKEVLHDYNGVTDPPEWMFLYKDHTIDFKKGKVYVDGTEIPIVFTEYNPFESIIRGTLEYIDNMELERNLRAIKEELFDASNEIKQSYNKIVNYFEVYYGKGKSYGNDSYGSDPYWSGSYEQDFPSIALKFAVLEHEFLKLGEPELYSLYQAIKLGNFVPDNCTKVCVLSALQAAAEGANTHRLVERIDRENDLYWYDWLQTHIRYVNFGKSNDDPRKLRFLREDARYYKFELTPSYKKFIHNPPMSMMAEDYPNDYYSDSYDNDSYDSDSYDNDSYDSDSYDF